MRAWTLAVGVALLGGVACGRSITRNNGRFFKDCRTEQKLTPSQAPCLGEGPTDTSSPALTPAYMSVGSKRARVDIHFAVYCLDAWRWDYVSAWIYWRHTWENLRSPADLLRSYRIAGSLPAGGTMLDLGANLGTYSVMFAASGWSVIAVEAMRQNQRVLNATLCLSPQLRGALTVVPRALGSPTNIASGEACVALASAGNQGDGRVSCARGLTCADYRHQPKLTCQSLPLATLDAVLEEAAPRTVDLVKMDVEGSECAVLEGAALLTTKYRPHVFVIEVKEKHVEACVRQFAVEHGYVVTPRWGGDNVALVDARSQLVRAKAVASALPSAAAGSGTNVSISAAWPRAGAHVTPARGSSRRL